jgi:hypothetical protein
VGHAHRLTPVPAHREQRFRVVVRVQQRHLATDQPGMGPGAAHRDRPATVQKHQRGIQPDRPRTEDRYLARTIGYRAYALTRTP